MKRNESDFKWRHFEPERILLCVRWYLRYQLSYRDVQQMMRERGLDVDHSTPSLFLLYFCSETRCPCEAAGRMILSFSEVTTGCE